MCKGVAPVHAQEKTRFLKFASEFKNMGVIYLTKREKAIFEYIDKNEIYKPLVIEMAALEKELTKLRKEPLVIHHPVFTDKTKPNPLAKIRKEFLQQYINIVKALEHIANKDGEEENSPLREFLEKFNE